MCAMPDCGSPCRSKDTGSDANLNQPTAKVDDSFVGALPFRPPLSVHESPIKEPQINKKSGIFPNERDVASKSRRLEAHGEMNGGPLLFLEFAHELVRFPESRI